MELFEAGYKPPAGIDLTRFKAQSIEYMTKALKLSPKNAGIHLQLATDYEATEDYKKASRHWQMVLALESDHPQRIAIVNLIEKYR